MIPRKAWGVFGIFVVLAAAGLFFFRTAPRRVCVGDACLKAEVAATKKGREKGLMFRTFLPADQGMLFVFPREDRWGFWMKNTLIPLDIIWMDRDRKIVDMAENVAPFRPPVGLAAEAPVLRPVVPSRYVLEVNAGFAKKNSVKIGDRARFAWIF